MKFYFDVPSEIESIEPVLTFAGPVSDKDLLLCVELAQADLPEAVRDAALHNYTLSPKLQAHYCYVKATSDSIAQQTFPLVMLDAVALHAAPTHGTSNVRIEVQVLPWLLNASEEAIAARVQSLRLRCLTALGQSMIHPLPAVGVELHGAQGGTQHGTGTEAN